MKKLFIIISILSVSSINVFGQNEVEAHSKTVKATLFLSGAQVHRQAYVNLQRGANVVKLTGLRQNINPTSIIIEGNPAFTIVSVEHKYNYLKKAQEMFEYKDLVNQREKLRWEIKKIQADKNVLDEEMNVLRANMEVKGREETLNIERLMDYADLYNDKQVDISIKRNELEKREREANERMNRLNKQLKEMEAMHNKSTSEIWVTLNANNTGNTYIMFNYYTTEASWKPFYDVRMSDDNEKIGFVLKGKLIQSTAENWEKVNLTLSTGNPSLNTVLPTLSAWNVYSAKPVVYATGKKKGKNTGYYGGDDYGGVVSKTPAAADYDKKAEEQKELEQEEVMAYNQPVATMKNNLTTMEYNITEAYTLPGDNQYYDVDIDVQQADSKKQYYSAPGYEQKVFVRSQIPSWTKLNLLGGEAAMYYNNQYVGKTDLDPESMEDTLKLSFGPDNNVLVTRRCIHEKTRSQVTGSNRIVNRTFEIVLRNNKNVPVELEVNDQLPVTYNKSISVDKVDLAGARYDEKTGYLNWKVKLGAGETKKIVFSYKVKYPKNSPITKF